MSQFDVEVNTVEFEGAMMRLREGVRKGFVDPQYGTLTVQGRLLSERCQAFTPPRNVAQGKAAVSRDITRIFMPLSHTTFREKGLRKIVRTDDRPAWDKVALNFNGSHNLQNTKAIGFSQGWHASNRISRGRARGLTGKKKGTPKHNLGVVTLGPEGRESRRYLKDVQKRVGWARAGWNMGIFALGGQAGSAGIQPWIRRHGVSRGIFVDGRNLPDPFVQVINDTSWAKHSNEGERIIRNAVSARARDMESYYFRMMRLAATNAGF